MNDTTSMRSVSTESDFSVPDYGLDPELNVIAHEIANFDPVDDTAGPVKMEGGWASMLPTTVPLTSLPPRFADPIKAKLANVSSAERPALEAKLINEALRQNSFEVRVKAGPGEGANAYQIESFAQARDKHELETRAWQLETELAEVVRWDNVVDQTTGQAKPVPVEKVQGHTRQLKVGELAEIQRKLSALEIEGPNRLKDALKKAAEAEQAKRQQLADHVEVERRAREMVREDRINERAATKARMLKGSIG